MLNKNATEFLIKLCEVQSSNNYTVKDWTEICDICPEEYKEIYKELWEQIKLNGCIDVKYFDDDEVCFALTDKARLIVEDYKVIQEEAKEDNAIVKTDSMGRSVVVLPKGKTFENAIKQNKSRLKSFLYGLFGGFIGGMAGGGIIYTILHFVVGA